MQANKTICTHFHDGTVSKRWNSSHDWPKLPAPVSRNAPLRPPAISGKPDADIRPLGKTNLGNGLVLQPFALTTVLRGEQCMIEAEPSIPLSQSTRQR